MRATWPGTRTRTTLAIPPTGYESRPTSTRFGSPPLRDRSPFTEGGEEPRRVPVQGAVRRELFALAIEPYPYPSRDAESAGYRPGHDRAGDRLARARPGSIHGLPGSRQRWDARLRYPLWSRLYSILNRAK